MTIEMTRSSRFLGLTLMLVGAGIAQASETATPVQRLQNATEISSIDGDGLRPWHLKLDVTLFDEAGKKPLPGSIEVWHDGTNTLTNYTFDNTTSSRLTKGKEKYGSASGALIPFQADLILHQFLHPGPTTDDVAQSTSEIRRSGLGKVALDCVMLSQPIPHRNEIPLGLYPTYCLETTSDRLVESHESIGESALRQRLGKFLDHEVTLEAKVFHNQAVIASAKVITLATFTPTAEQFEPTPEMKALRAARIGGGVMAGKILRKVNPVYPDIARANRISGAVVLHAIIDREGKIRSLRPISGPDPDLIISAIVAVRQWTYTPYLLNGAPTEVDTTITINYNLRP